MLTTTTTTTTNTIKKTDFIRALRAITQTKPANTRLALTLKNSQKVKALLPKFESYLKVWDLKIINRWQSDLDGTIEILINAQQMAEVRWVTNLAHDFFKSSLVGHCKK